MATLDLPEVVVAPSSMEAVGDAARGDPSGQNETGYGPGDRPDLARIDKSTGLPEEICVIIVNGQVFDDWETVWIQWSWTEYFSVFKFTCAEREPYPLVAPVPQLMNGSLCQIFLGGLLVVSGVILTRQVAYEGESHGVMLQGVSFTWFASRSSIDHKTSDFDGKTFLQIADEVLKPTGVGYKTVGEISSIPFKAGARPNPGEEIGAFLDRLARDRKIIVSNTPDGFFLFVGQHSRGASAELQEGVNIKKMQCIISDQQARSEYKTIAEKKASDESNGRDASEMEATAKGRLAIYSKLITSIEHPVETLAEVVKRNDTEVMWRDELDLVQATITVYGWFRPARSTTPSIAIDIGGAKGHTLWMAGDEVTVNSPMVPLNQTLKIHTVTWQQSRSSGTETVMLCVNPAGLNSGRFIPRSQPSSGARENPPRGDSFSDRFGR